MVVGFAYSQRSADGCREYYRPDKVVTANKTDIKTQLANDGYEHEKGLSGKACIGDNQAMLFVFDRPGYYNFWMKDMKFPIDIVWVGADKKIIEVTDNIQPSTYPDTFASNGAPKYVLEVGAGRAAELGLSAGKSLKF